MKKNKLCSKQATAKLRLSNDRMDIYKEFLKTLKKNNLIELEKENEESSRILLQFEKDTGLSTES